MSQALFERHCVAVGRPVRVDLTFEGRSLGRRGVVAWPARAAPSSEAAS